jgi:hypothetical protein
MGIIHGDVNRYNFIIDKTAGGARIVGFEHAGYFNDRKALLEMESLAAGLAEETGRGGPAKSVE